MRAYHPTDLQFASRHCGHALTLREQRVPYDRRPFEVGIAAHACLEYIAVKGREEGATLSDDAAAVLTRDRCEHLISKGREWGGHPEPPLAADSVWAGRKLALDWHAMEPVSHLAMVEVPLAVDEYGTAIAYGSKSAALKSVLDYVTIGERGDEESCSRWLTVRDYKSAWSTEAWELDTLQRKAQAVVACAAYGADVDAVLLEVVNLRTRQTYRKELWLRDYGDQIVADWWAEILSTIRALEEMKDENGYRAPVVGAHCYGCPYVSVCEGAREALTDPHDLAARFAVLGAEYDALSGIVKAACAEQPITLPGGFVGYEAKPQRRLTPEGVAQLVDEWRSYRGELGGFAAAADLSVSNAEAVSKVLYPLSTQRKEREEFVASLCTTVQQKRFGVHRNA